MNFLSSICENILKVIMNLDSDVKQVHVHPEKTTLPHYDAAAVMNAAVFKMLICRNEMHDSEPLAYCSQQRCIIAAACLSCSMREEQADNAPLCRSDSVR